MLNILNNSSFLSRRDCQSVRAVAVLRQTEDIPHQLLAHLSPLGWEHVNLTGDYIWSAERPVTQSRDGFRPLRAAPRYRSQGRLSSWFVRLCVQSGRFVTSGALVTALNLHLSYSCAPQTTHAALVTDDPFRTNCS